MFRTVMLWGLLATLAGCEPPPQAPKSTGDGLTISEARVRALIPGRDMTAAYFTAHNGGADPLLLVGAASDGARAVEMHVTVRDGGMMRMRRLDTVEIPAGGTVRFEPGGRHLMLFGVAELGKALDIELERADGTRTRVRFETIPMGGD